MPTVIKFDTGEFYNKNRPKLTLLAFNVLKNEDEADNVVAEVFDQVSKSPNEARKARCPGLFFGKLIINQAWEKLIQKLQNEHHDKLKRAAIRILRNETDAEDAVQDAFLKISRKRRRFLKADSRIGYMMEVVKKKALNVLRRKRGAGQLLGEDDDEVVDTQARTGFEVTASRDDYSLLARHIDNLEDREKVILFLRFEKDMSFSDMAREWKQNESSIRSIYHRTLHKLRQSMKESGLRKEENPYENL